ncbi:VOC family protein [Paraburkholderia sp. BCC1884]|uniref:VOC family protein n=1 Tax=Paraburkholderia sp. BCC1884 TaxID=2562668 RepID=UPI0011838C2A|nr:VOC family protein [Paraburkholderia sp. BCC1884]
MNITEAEKSLRDSANSLSPWKLAHVIFLTDRIPVMRDWYIRVLNAEVAFENANLCFLRYDDEHHRIGFIGATGMQPLPNGPSYVMDHYAFTYRGLGELLGTYLRLRDLGIEPYWTINHGPTTSIYYKDPDGHRIELQVDNFDESECEQFFASGNYDENPIGVNFDPDEWIRRYSEGEPVKELTKRPTLPPDVNAFDMVPQAHIS